MNDHTPGPWRIVRNKMSPRQIVNDANTISVAQIHGGEGEEITDANARLIAAAPETAAERDRLRKALEFYADYGNHEVEEIGPGQHVSTVTLDQGMKARAALAPADIPPLAPVTDRPVVPMGLLTTGLLEAARELLRRMDQYPSIDHLGIDRVELETAIDAVDDAQREVDAGREASETL